MTNGERNTQQPRTLRQTCALTKRRGKKREKKDNMGVKKEESNQERKNRKKDFILK